MSQAPFISTTPSSIINYMVTTSTLEVSGVDGSLWDVTLTTDITHTSNGQLDISLFSPQGTQVLLSNRKGGVADHVFAGTMWTDKANDPVTDHVFTHLQLASPLSPEHGLARLAGEDPNGSWELRIEDSQNLDEGALHGWSLNLRTSGDMLVQASTEHTSSPRVLITQDDLIEDELDVAVEGVVCDLDLTTEITHEAPTDLDVALVSPGGTVVTITTDNGGSNRDVFDGTVWDDGAEPTIVGYPFEDSVVATDLAPEGPLGAVRGEIAAGTWVLRVDDDGFGHDGELVSWTLHLTTCACDPIP